LAMTIQLSREKTPTS